MIITVVGLGVIGGSYVQALKGLGHEVYGCLLYTSRCV